MQYPYDLTEFAPSSNYVDADGETHAIYTLPAPKTWILRAPGIDVEVIVTKVRICLTTVGPMNEPTAVVVPFDDRKGKEMTIGTITFPGVISAVGVLERMGFIPTLPGN